MTQGAENDLLDIRFYQESTPVQFVRDNEPLEDLNNNILTVDDKAILARDTATTVSTDLGNHIGQGGVAEHAVATTGVAGFMSAADKAKLDLIQDGAQINILAPVDAIELISRGVTTLHSHALATPLLNGFMSATDKAKLDGIEAGAEVNNISDADAITLTTGGNADALHGHFFSAGSESFTEAVHATTNHTGIPGIAAFPGFSADEFNLGPTQVGIGTTIFAKPYSGFTTVEVLSAGFAEILDAGIWGASETFKINDVSISGTTGTVVYEIFASAAPGDMNMVCWQSGYGL